MVFDWAFVFSGDDYDIINLDVSKIQGKNGNIEYLAHFKRGVGSVDIDVDDMVNKAFSEYEV